MSEGYVIDGGGDPRRASTLTLEDVMPMAAIGLGFGTRESYLARFRDYRADAMASLVASRPAWADDADMERMADIAAELMTNASLRPSGSAS